MPELEKVAETDLSPSHHKHTAFILAHRFAGIAHSWEIPAAALREGPAKLLTGGSEIHQISLLFIGWQDDNAAATAA